MAGTSIKLFPDDSATQKKLGELMAGIKDLKPVMKDFGEYMLRETEQRFFDEKSPKGKAWKKLSKVTLRYKKGAKILTESSLLRGGVVYKPAKDSLQLGTNKIYGRIHQLGGMAGPGKKTKIPARPYLGFNDESMKEFHVLMKEFLLEE